MKDSLQTIIPAIQEPSPVSATAVVEPGTKPEKASKSRVATALELVQGQNIELFHTPDQQAYASFGVAGHIETRSLDSQEFEHWLNRLVYTQDKRALNKLALEETLTTLKAIALYEGEEHDVHLRVAEHEGKYYLDLANKSWQAVEISGTGWQVVDRPPVKFVRSKTMKPLPLPERGGSIRELQRYVNLREQDWAQVLGWVVAALRPQGPYPLLVLHGEQGSAKSTTARALRALVDPNVAPIRTVPDSERDLFVSAANNRVLAYDNLSSIPRWLSDAFCVLSTGGAFAGRQLYTNGDENIMNVQRPIILTGISELLTREDLASRALLIKLPVIEDSERKTEQEFWQEFERDHPRIFGALLDALSSGLATYSKVTLAEMPRLADFLKWAVSCEKGLELTPGTMITSYKANVETTTALAVENSCIIDPITILLQRRGGDIQLEASQLLDELVRETPELARNRRFPNTPSALGRQLSREAPNLRRLGIGYEPSRTSGSNSRRMHHLWQLEDEPTPIAVATCEEAPATSTPPTSEFSNHPSLASQVSHTNSDGCDDSDYRPGMIKIDGQWTELSF